ncbi:type II toxin-antitoxin system prevent-host-death family antitoxin [Flaviflexus salsibiostraticola]|uniref:Type II toxin-antitoxin system prevent-host-death family antitoxin n=1 Tax=Flaviflexus salsibiostraticola TaxID=1282737 RepID=A0A3Q8WUP4_9ACTO|nr:type II toxin-antitoxin system prevent-host-death family antitoxin [Flaviflexus salsibiostraticola]AZN30749.1 type II toxin-antitoxin system prevent-host-death family antitoxin [Flaviflexus salsibiostraticola]
MENDESVIETLSQRELRNESARVLRAVTSGQSFVLTNRGAPVAKIVPLSNQEPGLSITRPARRRGGWAELGIERRNHGESLSAILEDLRGDRL